MEGIGMVKLDHDSGSRSRTAGIVYPCDFLPDGGGSQDRCLEESLVTLRHGNLAEPLSGIRQVVLSGTIAEHFISPNDSVGSDCSMAWL
jgi:hypothetical protein